MTAIVTCSTFYPGFYFVWLKGHPFFEHVGDGFLAVVDDFGDLVAVQGGV